MRSPEEGAQRAREVAQRLGETLYEKQRAYGDSGAIALGLWQARLAQYLNEDGTHYVIPAELVAHFPRITRLDDRINRIISNPAGDRLGEDPWLDAAGDCIIGAISPRVQPPRVQVVLHSSPACDEAPFGWGKSLIACTLPAGHGGHHQCAFYGQGDYMPIWGEEVGDLKHADHAPWDPKRVRGLPAFIGPKGYSEGGPGLNELPQDPVCVDPLCERGPHDIEEPHRRVHAGGLQEWF